MKRSELLAVHDDAATIRPANLSISGYTDRPKTPAASRRVSIVVVVVVLIDYGETVLVAGR